MKVNPWALLSKRFTGFGRKLQPSVDSSVTFVKFGFVEGVIMDLLRFLGLLLWKASWSSVLENWHGTLFFYVCSWSPRTKRPGVELVDACWDAVIFSFFKLTNTPKETI